MSKEVDSFTKAEWKNIVALGKAAGKRKAPISELMSALSEKRETLSDLKEKVDRCTRTTLVTIYEVFIRVAAGPNEERKELELPRFQKKRGGKALNLFIAESIGLSKQRAYTLSLVVRKAASERVAVKGFSDWLKELKNLDDIAKEYADALKAGNGIETSDATKDVPTKSLKETSLSSSYGDVEALSDDSEGRRLGSGWEGISDLIAKAKRKKRSVKCLVWVRCHPNGEIDFVERKER